MIWSTIKFAIFCSAVLLAGQWITFQEKTVNEHLSKWLNYAKKSDLFQGATSEIQHLLGDAVEGSKKMGRSASAQFTSGGKGIQQEDSLNDDDRKNLQSLLKGNR